MITRRHFLAAQAVTPYLDKRGAPVQPGEPPSRELELLPYVPLGFFGPANASHETGGTVFMGVQLAIEHANQRRAPGARPFRLFSRWSDDPWRAGASAVVKLAMEDRVLAVIGGIDSATTHLAEQVAAKALFPLVDPVSTDETANAAFVPWIFSWAPGDSVIARALKEGLTGAGYTLLAATDHGSRRLAHVLARLAQPAERHDFQPPRMPPAPLHETVVVLAPALALCAVVRQLPRNTRILCGPTAWARACRRRLTAPVMAPVLAEVRPELLQAAEARFQAAGDVFLQLAYDSTALLIRCILSAGPDRSAVRGQLAAHFSPRGRRTVSSVSLKEVPLS